MFSLHWHLGCRIPFSCRAEVGVLVPRRPPPVSPWLERNKWCLVAAPSVASITAVQNPETTFEVYVEVAYPRTGGTLSDPEVQRQFPEDYSDQEVLQTLTKFCFPFYVDSLTVSQVGQNFTFVLTDIDSKQRFGFCRLSSGAKSCFCILRKKTASGFPWHNL
uniref:UDENN domain-containing protein n=2 Tax=Capra hircus TaxID=9925 RepID=A0A8C2R1K1_CAPHI